MLVPLFIAAAYDVMVPLAIVFGGAATGFIASFTNPFSAIIASNAAGINWIDGLYERLLFFAIATSMLVWYILRYAAKVKRDPTNSIVSKIDGVTKSPFEIEVHTEGALVKLSTKAKLLLLIFMLTFISMIVGIVFFNWWTLEMSALFFGSSILVGIIDRMNEKTFVGEFVTGAQGLLSVALIVGLARGVTIVLNDGLVGDSILVNSYLFGIGTMFLISPTGSVFLGLLMVKVSYKAWLKFITPFIIGILILSAIFLIIGIRF